MSERPGWWEHELRAHVRRDRILAFFAGAGIVAIVTALLGLAR